MESEAQAALVGAGDEYVALTPGALSFLVRHSFRERIFEFMEPYPNEVEPNWRPETLIAESVAVGWFVPASAVAVVTHRAKVDDLKAALVARGLQARGKRAELLEMVLAQCPEWVDGFAATKRAYYPTDKGRIELQATRPVRPEETKESHRQQMLDFLDHDVSDAKRSNIVIGFKISERDDRGWPRGDCTRIAALEGLYLPDELPDLYPADCPREDYCCCVSRVAVLSCDDTPDSRLLREKIAKRGMPEPPPPRDYEKERAEIEELERKRFAGNPAAKAKHDSLVKRIVSAILGR